MCAPQSFLSIFYSGVYSLANTIRLTGPGLVTGCIYDFLVNKDQICEQMIVQNRDSYVVIFPYATFHPVPNFVQISLSSRQEPRLAALSEKYCTEATVCIHWWQKSWQK
jgi:hypothetical protein